MKTIVAMLVKGGMTEAQAVEAVANYTEADYLAEVEAEALEEARWAEEERLYGNTDYELDLYEADEETEVIDFYFDKERRTWVIIDA